jgi:hypothetical protein
VTATAATSARLAPMNARVHPLCPRRNALVLSPLTISRLVRSRRTGAQHVGARSPLETPQEGVRFTAHS